MTAAEETNVTSRFLALSQVNSSEFSTVNIDHCYSKPWSSHPDASNARPVHMLFMDKLPSLASLEKQRSISNIEVTDDEEGIPPLYDTCKVRSVLSYYEDSLADYSDGGDDWEDHIASVRTTWSVLQNRLFAKVIRVLQSDRLARLTVQGVHCESVQRKLQVDKAAERVRFCFGSVGWDMTLVLWLHNLLLENLRGQLLTSYLEVLVTLKAKIPSLVNRLIEIAASRQGFAMEYLNGLLKRGLDPFHSSANLQKLKRLPDNPLLLVISHAVPSPQYHAMFKRLKFWQHQLSGIGKVINIAPDNSTAITHISGFVENMITVTKSKILEVKGHCPGRPVILIGFHIGALVAMHVAAVELVHGIVCLGFPTVGICGSCGEIDDQIYACKTPTLFVVGQHASNCSVDVLEDIREKLRVETGLVIVGGADDQLRMSHAKKRIFSVTQTVVDRCIMDEIFEFLGNILSQIVMKPQVTSDAEIIRKQRKRKQIDASPITCSKTRNISQQLTVKTVRPLKLASGGTLSLGARWSVAGTTKMAKRTSPKKHANKSEGNRVLNKKSTLNFNYPVFETSTADSEKLSKVNEEAAIASAPELSNLLQSIQNSGKQRLTTDISSSSLNNNNVASSYAAVATTTTLTLSRFLASSGLFRPSALIKAKELCSDDSEPGVLKSSFDAFTKTPVLDQSHFDDQFNKQPHTSIPFSMPLTFTVASKVLKSSPVLRVTGDNPDVSHTQQLSASASRIFLPLITSCATGQISTSVSATASLHNLSITHSSYDSKQPVASGVTTASINLPSTLISKSVSSMGTLSPRASVITIGSDAVLMEEAAPNAPVPDTVSIDLGQIAAGTKSSVMKLKSVPKISLIPSVKQIPVLLDKFHFTKTSHSCHPSIATTSSVSQLAKLSTVSSIVASVKPSISAIADLTKSFSTNILSALPSSQLLSTLSSNAELVTVKLPVQTAGILPANQDVLSKIDQAPGHKSDVSSTQSEGNLNVEDQKTDHSFRIEQYSTSIAVETEHNQNLLLESSTNFSTNPTPLITSENKTCKEHILLKCHGAESGADQFPVSPKPVLSESLEPAVSLSKSCPVTVEDDRKLLSTKQTNKALPAFAASMPSTDSSLFVNQIHTTAKSNKTVVSYSTTSKSTLPTIASTRTRRIKTPKLYDL